MTKDSHSNLISYLNDHLAGSIAAIELIDDLSGASENQSLKQFLVDIKREIEADQKVLQGLINNTSESESSVRKAAAWISEKAARMKFKVAGEDFGGLGLVQALEMLGLGIRGKELLWRSLGQAGLTGLGNIDLAGLEQRAVVQQQWVETRRLEAARAAFGSINIKRHEI
jgi:hypothetical protein